MPVAPVVSRAEPARRADALPLAGDSRTVVAVRRRRRRLPQTWAAAALLALATGGAFWFSLYSASAGGLDSPLALAPAAVPLAGWAGYLALRRAGSFEANRDAMLDGAVGAILILAALWLVWLEPDALGWRYWSERRDLIALELFALGAACWLFGLATVWRARPGLLVLLLGSPPVIVWLQERLAGPLALLTATVARLITTGLGLHFLQTTDPTLFRGVSDGGVSYWILIADICSGLASWITILMMSVPAGLYLGLGVLGTVTWMGIGLALASVANIVRVVVLLVVAQRIDPSVALGVVHPVLGAALLFAVVCALIFVVESVPLPSLQWTPTLTKRGSSVVLAATLIAGIGQVRLLPFDRLPSGGPPGPSVTEALDVLPRMAGWQPVMDHELSWQNLFGPSSHSYLLRYVSAEGLTVTTQLVATPQLRSLLTYTPEQCGVYHGEDVRGQKSVDLGRGEVGYLVDSQEQVPIDRAHPDQGLRPLQFDVLYWYVPFTVKGEVWNARFTLILDSDFKDSLPDAAANRGLAPGGQDYDKVDGALVSLGRQMISTLAQAA